MSFTDEKIKVLNSLLSQYEFSAGFTYYGSKNKVSDTGSSSKHYISLSGYKPLSKKELSGGKNFALFPIVFDYLDAVLDRKLSVSNMKFGQKRSMLSSLNRDDNVIGFLESETFSKALELRNKIIHNNLTMSEETGEISLPSGQKYRINDFSLLNRLVFNVALMCSKSKIYSLYEKSAALSILEKIFGIALPDAVKLLYKNGSLVQMNTCARMYSDFSEKTISPSEPLFDVLSENIELRSEDDGKVKFKKVIYANRTFKFRVRDVDIIIPAELINQDKSLALQDVGDWCI